MILTSTLAVAKVNEEDIVVFEDCGRNERFLKRSAYELTLKGQL
jgi:hypothetical protein